MGVYYDPLAGFDGSGGDQLIPGMGGMNATGTSNPGSIGGKVMYSGTNLPMSDPTGTATNIPATSGFPANTGGMAPTSVQGMDVGSLTGLNGPELEGQFNSLFGDGIGSALYKFLSTGSGYNPQVGQALLNQMEPYAERQRNNILEAFGSAGNRYSSPAAIGLADFDSSFALGQQGILANLFNNSVDRSANLFGGVLDTAHLEQANKTSLSDILSGILGIGSSTGLLDKLINAIKKIGGGGGSASGGASGGTTGGIDLNGVIKAIGGLFGSGKPPNLPAGTPNPDADLITQILGGITGGNPTLGSGTGSSHSITDTGGNLLDFSIPYDPMGNVDFGQLLNNLGGGPTGSISDIPGFISNDSGLSDIINQMYDLPLPTNSGVYPWFSSTENSWWEGE